MIEIAEMTFSQLETHASDGMKIATQRPGDSEVGINPICYSGGGRPQSACTRGSMPAYLGGEREPHLVLKASMNGGNTMGCLAYFVIGEV